MVNPPLPFSSFLQQLACLQDFFKIRDYELSHLPLLQANPTTTRSWLVRTKNVLQRCS